MIIKQNFTLLKGATNLVNLSKSQIDSLTLEGNSPKHVFVTLELKKNLIRHFAVDKILEYVKNVKITKDLNVLVWDQYPLVVSYNQKTHSKIVNIAPEFNAKELSRVAYMSLYASILYAYTFESIVTKKLRIPDSMASIISNIWFSMFVKVFGRNYGMTGTYSSKLPALKFMLTSYILIAFFGKKQETPTFNLAKQYSGYDYSDKVDVLKRHDLTDIKGLIDALSDAEIMPGLNLVKFTTKVYNFFGVQFLPGFEDLARFMSLIMTSTVGGQAISKPFIKRYSEKNYVQLYQYMQKKLF
jgi:hypothetical protein